MFLPNYIFRFFPLRGASGRRHLTDKKKTLSYSLYCYTIDENLPKTDSKQSAMHGEKEEDFVAAEKDRMQKGNRRISLREHYQTSIHASSSLSLLLPQLFRRILCGFTFHFFLAYYDERFG
jgi:hypothetical protein